MKIFVGLLAAATLAGVAGSALLHAQSEAASTAASSASAAPAFQPPRTPWGKPDFTGTSPGWKTTVSDPFVANG